MTREVGTYLRGWQGYYGFCQTPSIFPPLNRWIRRRLRCAAWAQWKRGRTRFDELRKRGVPRWQAAKAASTRYSAWRVCSLSQMYMALPGAYFAMLGLPTLATR